MSEPSEAVKRQGWSKNLADCDQKIINAYPIVAAKFGMAHPDLWMRNDYSWRSAEFQHSLFEKGRKLVNGVWVLVDPALKVTNNDGILNPSKHQPYPSHALDFIIFRGQAALWSSKTDLVSKALYEEVGHLFESQGLVSGAFWKWVDAGHVQIA